MAARFALVGAGNMGAAILRGALEAGVLEPKAVLVIEPDASRRETMAALGCPTSATTADANGAEQLLLAVKPQGFAAVAEAVGMLSAPARVISIMAGIPSPTIREALGPQARVVRVMPNTPAQIGRGMSAIAAGEGALEGDVEEVTRLFDAVGRTLRLREDQFDAVTAVSGSGPAYVFLLVEAIERGALAQGFDEAQARLLARETVIGAARLLEASRLDAAALRAAVTSPGGTTEAALGTMLERGFVETVVAGIAAAQARGQALAKS